MSDDVLRLAPSRKIQIVFEDKEYSASPIRLGDQVELEEHLEKMQAKGHGGALMTQKLLVKCGLPEEMVKRLDVDQLDAVVQSLKPAKKK